MAASLRINLHVSALVQVKSSWSVDGGCAILFVCIASVIIFGLLEEDARAGF